MIVKLPLDGDPSKPQRHRFVNSDRILWFEACGPLTRLHLTSDDEVFATLPPDELAALLDPDSYCADGGPSRCGYHTYLASPRHSGDLSPDLPHQAYHTARSEAERHARMCTTQGYCYGCQGHERVLRA